jgi:hypothetical protein
MMEIQRVVFDVGTEILNNVTYRPTAKQRLDKHGPTRQILGKKKSVAG